MDEGGGQWQERPFWAEEKATLEESKLGFQRHPQTTSNWGVNGDHGRGVNGGEVETLTLLPD